MELCLICGKEFDLIMDPHHEMDCEDRYAESMATRIKPIPELEKILKSVIQKPKNEFAPLSRKRNIQKTQADTHEEDQERKNN